MTRCRPGVHRRPPGVEPKPFLPTIHLVEPVDELVLLGRRPDPDEEDDD
jgi:hypothetical protein